MAEDIKLVRVRASAAGYGGVPTDRRNRGDEFDVPEGTKGSWFKPLAEAEPAPPTPEKQKPVALGEHAKAAGKSVPAVTQFKKKDDASDLV
jgi:hypothetical protein